MGKIKIDTSRFKEEKRYRISYVAIYNKKQDFIDIPAKSESEAREFARNEIKQKHRIKNFIIKDCEIVTLMILR